MANKWYYLTSHGHYVRRVDMEHSDDKACVYCTDKIVDTKLLTDHQRKNWIISFLMTMQIDPADLKSYKCDVETVRVDTPDDDTLYAIRFTYPDQPCKWIARVRSDGIDTIGTDNELSESERYDLADLNDKETTDKLFNLISAMQKLGILADELANADIEIVPTKRTFNNIVEL